MQLGTMSNMFGALKSGAVEASVVSPPTQFLSEKMGFKEIVSITEMDLAYPNPSMAVSGELIRKKADLIDRFMRAYVRAMQRARADRDGTIKTLAKYTTIADIGDTESHLRFLHEQSSRTRALHQHAGHAKCSRRCRENRPSGEDRQSGTVRRPAVSRQNRKERTTQGPLQVKIQSRAMNKHATSCGYQKKSHQISQSRHPRMFLSGVQFPISLDSRLIHAGMTVFGNDISLHTNVRGI